VLLARAVVSVVVCLAGLVGCRFAHGGLADCAASKLFASVHSPGEAALERDIARLRRCADEWLGTSASRRARSTRSSPEVACSPPRRAQSLRFSFAHAWCAGAVGVDARWVHIDCRPHDVAELCTMSCF